MTRPPRELAAILRAYALELPGAYEDFPWGERVAKVNRRIFAFLGRDEHVDEGLYLGVKLPISGAEALKLPFVRPEGYGLGKSGWVAAHFPSRHDPPIDLLLQWIEESYRAVAPKRLVAQLDRATPRKPPRQPDSLGDEGRS